MNEKSGVLYVQWQIQDFPVVANPRWGLLLGIIFAKNCMKIKKFDRDVRHEGRVPPRSATD